MPSQMLKNSRVEPRDRWVTVRVTGEEKNLIDDAAKERGQKTAEFVRDALRRELDRAEDD